ncbi:MAG: hypothetical protein RSE24_00620 [Oscillospiraceae bacterium]
MKKLLTIALAGMMILSLTACGSKDAGDGAAAGKDKNIEGTLPEIMEKITAVDTLKDIMTMDEELTAENFTFHTKTEMPKGVEGLVSGSAIGSQAHAVVLLRLPADADGDAIAKDILAKNTDGSPSKWICVMAEKVEVIRHGDLILFVQSWEDTTNEIVAKFNELAK